VTWRGSSIVPDTGSGDRKSLLQVIGDLEPGGPRAGGTLARYTRWSMANGARRAMHATFSFSLF